MDMNSNWLMVSGSVVGGMILTKCNFVPNSAWWEAEMKIKAASNQNKKLQ